MVADQVADGERDGGTGHPVAHLGMHRRQVSPGVLVWAAERPAEQIERVCLESLRVIREVWLDAGVKAQPCVEVVDERAQQAGADQCVDVRLLDHEALAPSSPAGLNVNMTCRASGSYVPTRRSSHAVQVSTGRD